MPAKFFLTSRRDWIFDIFSLSLLLYIFYTFWLGSYPLFTPDEGRYSEVAREMVATGDYITPRVNGVAFLDKPVLYYWLQAAAIHLFGVKEWALRFFPALFGMLGCLLTYTCGRCLFDRRTGLLSAVILAATPLYFGCAHYANLDLEVAVLISGTLLCFITAMHTQGGSRVFLLMASYAFAALAFLTKGLIGVAFPAMIAGSWILLLWQWQLLKKIWLPAGLLLFSIMVLPWYYFVQRANPEFLHYFFVTQQVTRFLSAAQFNNPMPVWFYLPIVLAGFFPWTCFLIQAFARHISNVVRVGSQHKTELFLMLWVGIVFLFFSIPKSKMISYILPVFPPMALLTGNYLALAWDNVSQKTLYLSIGILTASIVLILSLLTASIQLDWVDYPQGFLPYLSFIMTVLAACAVSAILLVKQPRLMPLFSICAISGITILLTLMMGASYLNQNTARPLTTMLKPQLRPEDEVVNYYKFYQDVPLYLGRRVTLVADWNSAEIPSKDNWVRELWYGMAFQKTDDWLINQDTFWQRWHSGKRIFVFLNANYLADFRKHTSAYYTVGRYKDIIVLSNKPVT